MTIKVIHNPYSARWTSGKRLPEIRAAFERLNLDYDLVQTTGPGHAIDLAAEAAQAGFPTIVAAGGDGTIGEVINGIMLGAGDNHLPKFGVMPTGTANDLICNIRQSVNLNKAAEVIANGKTRQIDLCQVNDRYFLNNAGIGLEPFTTTVQERIPWLHGTSRYLLATILSILRNPQWQMRLEWDHGKYEGPVTMVSISNGPQTGGVFFTVPHADPFDGKLSFVYGHIQSRVKILQVLPDTMKPAEGNYVEHPAIHEEHCTWLKVQVEPATPAHTDGELFDRSIKELAYRIYPAKIPILLGD